MSMLFPACTNVKVWKPDHKHMVELAEGMLSHIVSRASSAPRERRSRRPLRSERERVCEQGTIIGSFAKTNAVCHELRMSQNTVPQTPSKDSD